MQDAIKLASCGDIHFYTVYLDKKCISQIVINFAKLWSHSSLPYLYYVRSIFYLNIKRAEFGIKALEPLHMPDCTGKEATKNWSIFFLKKKDARRLQ